MDVTLLHVGTLIGDEQPWSIKGQGTPTYHAKLTETNTKDMTQQANDNRRIQKALDRQKNHIEQHSVGNSVADTAKTKTSSSLSLSSLNVTGLLQLGYFDQLGLSIAKVYPAKSSQVRSLNIPQRFSKTNNRLPQIYKEPVEGLYYNKVPKTASSTLAGINQRISFRWGHRLYAPPGDDPDTYVRQNTTCSHKQAHILGAGKYYGNRVLEKSFLWGSIRDPASRALSRVYFHHISQKNVPDNDETILEILKQDDNPQSGIMTKGKGGFQLQYLPLDHLKEWYAWDKRFPSVVQNFKTIQQNVKNVLDGYDFLAVTERMEESMVAMQLLLGLRVGDILSTSAKIGGAFYFDKQRNECISIQKTKYSPGVKEYLESDEWQAANYGDYLLYAVANHSIDQTIEWLGNNRFASALAIYRNAQRIVSQQCTEHTHFPCSDDGKVQLKRSKSGCYMADEGCGYACIDRLVKERGW